MCGRYVTPASAAIERAWRVDRRTGDPFARRTNVAPTSGVPVLLPADGLTLAPARWGLVPHWWSAPAPPKLTFNARAEEAAAKPMWKAALRSTRCLVPAEGWYEWRPVERVDPRSGEIRLAKQPWFIRRPDCALFAFAGLYGWWRSAADAEPQLSCTILTTAARAPLLEVHERMPVVLDEQAQARWLAAIDSPADAAPLLEVMRAAAASAFESYPIVWLEEPEARLAVAAAPALRDLFS